MKTLFLDTETYCETPIQHGTYRYAEDVEIMIVTWAWNDEPAVCWDWTNLSAAEGDAQRLKLQAMVDEADEIVIHNSMFDRTVLAADGVTIPAEKIVDTMVIALSHSLPGSLDTLCDVLGVSTDKAKLKTGRRWIQLFCKPLPKNQKLRRATRLTHPEQWREFKDYATQDIPSMREVRRLMPSWNYPREAERELWVLDQRINDRGVAVDTELARCALRAADRAKALLAKQAHVLSDGAVPSATQRNRVIAYLAEAHGFATADLKGSTVEKILESAPDLHPEVREMLLIRQEAAATSPAKYGTLLKGVSADGRLRGTLQFAGASRTARWGGRLFQPQNLPRPSLKQAVIDSGIAAMKADCEDLVVGNVMEVCTSAVRGCIVATSGKKLVIADLSNIEGRMLAWLAGEEWKLEAFRQFDQGIGHDLYKLAYAKAFGVDPEDVDSQQRQIGKVLELFLGYEGGVGAFITGANTYGFDIEEMARNVIGTIPVATRESAEGMLAWRRDKGLTIYDLSDVGFVVCESFKALWRAKHPATVQLWRDAGGAMLDAVRQPGVVYRAGRLAFQRDGAWLRMRLPSGRYVCYAAPQIDDRKVSYEGVDQYTRRWKRIGTYSGRVIENACQAAARDVLCPRTQERRGERLPGRPARPRRTDLRDA
jgi:DNA polymerase